MRFIPHPTDPQIAVNIDEVIAGLRDRERLMKESDDENCSLAADFVEAYARIASER